MAPFPHFLLRPNQTSCVVAQKVYGLHAGGIEGAEPTGRGKSASPDV